MDVKITCVYDEGSLERTGLIGAKGTAFLVDTGDKRVLVDTGLRDRYLAHNLEGLEVDPDSIDAVIVSQRHPDNCRALDGLLKNRTKPVDVYCPEGTYSGKKGMLSGSVGISSDHADKAVLHPTGVWTEVVPGVHVTPAVTDSKGNSETYTAVDFYKKLIVISGRGINGPEQPLTMVSEHFGRKVDVFIGSVLLEKAKKPVAESYARSFMDHGCMELYLNHCTGIDGMTNLRVHLGLRGVSDFYVGSVYDPREYLRN